MNADELRARIGQELGASDWLTITQERVNAFAAATGDHQFIHVDPQRAARTPFGGAVAHGFLTLSLLAGELSVDGVLDDSAAQMVVNYGLNRVRFIAAVPVGGRIRNRALLQAIAEGSGYLQLTVLNTVELEGQDRPAMTAETVMRVYS